jgi:acyl-coenzyme A thioesterase PaaI-like protein
MGTWPQVSISLPEGYSLCFGCGQDNPIGLKMKFVPDGKGVRAVFNPDERYQGWPGYLHGGIVACLLDEAMSHAAGATGARCVTARFETRLKRLVPISGPLTVTSHVTRKTRKVIECASVLSLADGTIAAEGSATHFVIDARPESGKNDK